MKLLLSLVVIFLFVLNTFARRDEYVSSILRASPTFNPNIPDGMITNDELLHQYITYERAGLIDGIGARWDESSVPKPTISTYNLKIDKNDYPKEWDWRKHAKLHSQVLTQRVPRWCGACFAFASLSALTDRYLINHPAEYSGSILSVQDVLNCAEDMGFGKVGCDGSDYERVYSYVEKYGVVDSTCAPYEGTRRTHTVLHKECPEYQCRQCTSDGGCGIIENAKRWGISGWGKVSGEAEMINELYSRGPLACYIYTYIDPYIKYKGGIISDPTIFAPGNITHVVELVGYGSENDVPYWTLRNWAGTQWGEGGFFRVYRGNNTMNMEWNCGYAIPNPAF